MKNWHFERSTVMRLVKIFLGIVLLFLTISANAQAANENLTVGVPRFVSRVPEMTNEQAAIFTGLFASEFDSSIGILVMDSETIDSIIGQGSQFYTPPLVNPLTVAEIGKIAGLDYMLLGSITQIDRVFHIRPMAVNVTIDMRIVDMQTAQVKTTVLQAQGNVRNRLPPFWNDSETYLRWAIEDAISKLSAQVRRTLDEGNQQDAEVTEGFDPNTSTDAKVIETFPLSPGERNLIGIQYRNAFNLYSSQRYQEAFDIFAKIATDINCNYLSAYWAGMACLKLENNLGAALWFDYALDINPNYQPAKTERGKL